MVADRLMTILGFNEIIAAALTTFVTKLVRRSATIVLVARGSLVTEFFSSKLVACNRKQSQAVAGV